ncbi:MAG: GIY-YIG nuclease family protein, partial [Actinobacteria bacterium]|nr:GIY-YIG nuclease family protein [Actinomycetota bacterium]
ALYIGKAENLRRRTRDHFLQRQAYGARQALELLERFEVVETGSEFAALLLEQRLIARHRPLDNSHGTRVSSYHYVKLSAEEFPRLYATPNLRDDGSYYAGPFRKASLTRRFVECLNGVYPLRTCAHLPAAAGKGGRASHACPRAGTGACLAPCSRHLNGEYAAAVTAVRRVLEGHGEDLDERLQERQASMVQALAFEQAARLQKQREALERALRTVRRLHDAGRDDAIIAYPARRAGWVALWGVRGGGVAVERVVGRAAFGDDAACGLLTALVAAAPPSPPLPATMLDEMLLVHSWLQSHREAANVLDMCDLLDGRQPLAEAAAALVGRVRLCAALPYSSSALPRPRRSRSTATTAIAATATATTT